MKIRMEQSITSDYAVVVSSIKGIEGATRVPSDGNIYVGYGYKYNNICNYNATIKRDIEPFVVGYKDHLLRLESYDDIDIITNNMNIKLLAKIKELEDRLNEHEHALLQCKELLDKYQIPLKNQTSAT